MRKMHRAASEHPVTDRMNGNILLNRRCLGNIREAEIHDMLSCGDEGDLRGICPDDLGCLDKVGPSIERDHVDILIFGVNQFDVVDENFGNERGILLSVRHHLTMAVDDIHEDLRVSRYGSDDVDEGFLLNGGCVTAHTDTPDLFSLSIMRLFSAISILCALSRSCPLVRFPSGSLKEQLVFLIALTKV